MTRKINDEMVSKYFSELGKKGGPARAKSLTAERRHEIALNAINTRWKNISKKNK